MDGYGSIIADDLLEKQLQDASDFCRCGCWIYGTAGVVIIVCWGLIASRMMFIVFDLSSSGKRGLGK